MLEFLFDQFQEWEPGQTISYCGFLDSRGGEASSHAVLLAERLFFYEHVGFYQHCILPKFAPISGFQT